MNDAQAKLVARIASLTTDQLKEISLRLALDPSKEAIIVCAKVEAELEQRLPEAEMLAHCAMLDALLDAAA